MKVAPGGTSMLTWATPDDSSVTISPAPDPLHAQAYGPNASATVKVPTTPGAVTYNFTSSSGGSASITLTVAAPVAGEPTVTITHIAENDLDVAAHGRLVQPAPRAERVVLDERTHIGTELDEALGEVAADESSGAGDEDPPARPVAHSPSTSASAFS